MSAIGRECSQLALGVVTLVAFSGPFMAPAYGNQMVDHPPEVIAQLREIAQGYFDNWESFPFFTCRFIITDGKVKSLEKAIEVGPTADKVVLEGIWVVDKELNRVRYERRPPGTVPFEMRPLETPGLKATPDGNLTATLPAVIYLGEGDLALSLDGLISGGAVLSPKSPPPGVSMTPWDLGGAISPYKELSPGNVVATYLETYPEVKFELKSPVEIDGRVLLRFDVDLGDLVLVYHVDPSRGYLPIQMSLLIKRTNTAIIKAYTTHIRQVSQERWFPERCVAVWLSGDEDSGNHTARELRVTDLDVENRPDDDLFTTTIPTRTQVHDGVTPGAVTYLEENDTVHVRDLGGLLSLAEAAATQRVSIGQGTGGGNSLRWWAIAINVGAIMMLLAFFYVRRMRRA